MKNIKKYITTGIFLLSLGWFIYKIIYGEIRSKVLTGKSPQIKAVIINEKNYFGNSPVSHEFAYSYFFKIGDMVYKGNSLESKLKVGDTILVRYLASNPKMNEPVNYNPK